MCGLYKIAKTALQHSQQIKHEGTAGGRDRYQPVSPPVPVEPDTSVECVPKQMAPVHRYRNNRVAKNSVNTACSEPMGLQSHEIKVPCAAVSNWMCLFTFVRSATFE